MLIKLEFITVQPTLGRTLVKVKTICKAKEYTALRTGCHGEKNSALIFKHYGKLYK